MKTFIRINNCLTFSELYREYVYQIPTARIEDMFEVALASCCMNSAVENFKLFLKNNFLKNIFIQKYDSLIDMYKWIIIFIFNEDEKFFFYIDKFKIKDRIFKKTKQNFFKELELKHIEYISFRIN